MSNISNQEDRRADFIKEMYRVYWANISRSMEGVWKILAPITIAGTIIAAVHKDYLPPSLGISLAFIIILWALNVTIDLNAWHRRNLFFVVKAEKQFLFEEDYGQLIPKKYRNPKKGWITFYIINVGAFLFFLALTFWYAWFWKFPKAGLIDGWLLPIVVLSVGLILTILNFQVNEKSAKKRFKELFGQDVNEDRTNPNDNKRAK